MMTIDEETDLFTLNQTATTTNNRFAEFAEFTGFTLTLCVLYGILFCFGIVGNLWVVSVVMYILKSFRCCLAQNQNIFLYILSLSIVDAMVLMTLPMLVCDIYFVRWIFGGYLCKMYWMIESVNKIMSKFILTAMSFDRFLAVCKPNRQHCIRTSKGTGVVLLFIAVIVVISMYPVYVHAQEIFFDEVYLLNNQTITSHRSKCVLHMSDDLTLSFTVYLFIVGFCIPSVLIIYFYCRILLELYLHAKGMHSASTTSGSTSHINLRRVTCATFMLILIYFVCWAPFWFTVLYAAYDPEEEPSVGEVYLMYFVHLLVYINSSVNWILYAFLNRNLKETRILAVKRNAESKTRLLDITENRKANRKFSTFNNESTISNQWL